MGTVCSSCWTFLSKLWRNRCKQGRINESALWVLPWASWVLYTRGHCSLGEGILYSKQNPNTVIKIHFKHPPPPHPYNLAPLVNNVISKDAALEQVPSSFLLASLPFGNTVFLQWFSMKSLLWGAPSGKHCGNEADHIVYKTEPFVQVLPQWGVFVIIKVPDFTKGGEGKN